MKILFYSKDVFKMDPNFMENEEKYKMLKKGRGVCTHVLYIIFTHLFIGHLLNQLLLPTLII